MVSRRLYYLLGLTAILVALLSLILSIIMYLRGFYEYLWYSIMWFIILLLDILVWRSPPKQLKEGVYEKDLGGCVLEKLCSDLREIAELVSILYTLSIEGGKGYSVSYRAGSVVHRLSEILEELSHYCGCECRDKLEDILRGDISSEAVGEFLVILNNCMERYGCVSNIAIE